MAVNSGITAPLNVSVNGLCDAELKPKLSKSMVRCIKMHNETGSRNRRNAYLSIVILGIVSLIGDIVYEGSRGIVPSYLEFLGATALIVSLVGGLGDFLGYALRLVSGKF